MKLLIAVSVTIFGSLGWWLGSKISIYAALLFSTVGSLVGLYIAYKVYKELF